MEQNFTFTFLKDTSIQNLKYRKLNVTQQGEAFYNCNNGVTTQLLANPNNPSSILKFTVLKANEPIGAMWIDTINNGGQDFYFTYTIVAKNTSKVVLGKSYNDVIFLKSETTAIISGFTINAGKSEYYIANNVGLIESFSIDNTSPVDNVILHRVLKSANIP